MVLICVFVEFSLQYHRYEFWPYKMCLVSSANFVAPNTLVVCSLSQQQNVKNQSVIEKCKSQVDVLVELQQVYPEYVCYLR
jgi:hypothetical protein